MRVRIIMSDRLNRKRNTDMKYYYRKKLRESGVEYDNTMDLEELKSLYFLLVKIPKKRKPIETTKTDDHLSRQHYEALEQIKKAELAEAENIHMRSRIKEGESSLLHDRGGDEIPLSVINNSRINLDQYLGNSKKREKEKAKKSSWRI